MKKNNFQIVLVSVFVFFIILGVVVFSSYKAKQGANATVEVTIWGTVDSTSFDSFISKLKIDLNKEVKAKYIEKDAATLDSDLVEAIASGSGPDAVILPQDLIVRYSDKVYMIPFTSLSQRSYLDTFIQEGELYLTSDGMLALPFFVDPLVMYWNRDIFSSASIANPPTKWSEFPLIAEKISKSDSNANIIQSAVALGGFRNIDNAKALISAMIMQAGSPIVKADGGKLKSFLSTKSAIDLEVPAQSALRFYTDYSNPRKTVYSWNNALPSAKSMFLSGDLATYFGKASEIDDIRSKNPNLNFDVAMLPQTVDAQNKITFGEMQGFAILKSSPNIASAFMAISTLIGADTVPVFLQFNNYAPARRDVIASGSADPVKAVFYNSALISKGWLDPNSKKTDTVFQNMIDNITTGAMKLDGAVQKASQELDYLL